MFLLPSISCISSCIAHRRFIGPLSKGYYAISFKLDYGLMLLKHSTWTLDAFADADWASDPNDRTSTSAYVVFLGAIPISWSSKKQKTVARSSTKAEYRAIASTTAEVHWIMIMNLLQDLKVAIAHTPVIYCNNVCATYACVNPVFHSCMKHIAIDFHFVQDQVATGRLQIHHMHTYDKLRTHS